ncbi:MAG: flavodoxin family protein [Pseudomonadota bacterium]
MKLTVFNGSPRGKNGNTHFMVKEFIQGVKEAGSEIENIFLTEKEINYCLGCFDCWTKTPGKCIQKDDMEGLLREFMSSDIVVFATPLYVFNVTGLMKNFMDRLLPLSGPHFGKDKTGVCKHEKRFEKYPKLVVISNCGFPELSHFKVLHLLFDTFAKDMHSEIIAEIYKGGGEIFKETSFLLRPSIWNYKRLLRKAGREIVENLKISEKTLLKLEKPIISDYQYIRGANKHWDKMIKRVKQ